MCTNAEILPLIEKAFEEFSKTYCPTENNTCELKGTAEIQRMVNDLTGIELTRFEVADKMRNTGYKFKLIEDEFFWMVEKV